jgi:hypothetical protein
VFTEIYLALSILTVVFSLMVISCADRTRDKIYFLIMASISMTGIVVVLCKS